MKGIALTAIMIFAFLVAACTEVALGPVPPFAPSTPPTGTRIPKGYFLTRAAETYPASLASHAFTLTVAFATNYAQGTAEALTATAWPTATPTPTFPADARFCTARDLEGQGGRAMGAGGGMYSGVGVINISDSPCYLATWPALTVLNPPGQNQAVQVGWGPEWDGLAVAQQASDSPSAKVGLLPRWAAYMSFTWRNGCNDAVLPPSVIRWTLLSSGEHIDIQTLVSGGGHCDQPDSPSYIHLQRLRVYPPEGTLGDSTRRLRHNPVHSR